MGIMFGILFSPIVLSIVILLFHFIPNVSNFLSNIFWSWLGSIDFFPMTIDLIQKYSSHKTVRLEGIFESYLSLMIYGALDAIFMGCCIFIVKSIFSTFRIVTNKGGNYDSYYFWTRGPKWLLSLIGVIVSVSLQPVFGVGFGHAKVILKSVFSILLLIFGIAKIWTAGNKTKSYRDSDYEKKRESFLVKLLVSILINAFEAIAVANILALLLEFGRMWRAGAHFFPMLTWLFCSFLLAFLCQLLSHKNSS